MESHSGPPKAPCKACTDFKTWASSQKKVYTEIHKDDAKTINHGKDPVSKECPLDRQELGRNSWSVLHTMAAYYSETPTTSEQKEMQQFISLFTKFYPCHDCSEDFMEKMSQHPPETQSREKLSTWLCQMHNQVNVKLGKEQFDCATVLKRWREGWDDGSCS